MNRIKLIAVVVCAVAVHSAVRADEQFATRQQVEALVARTVQAVNADKAATLREITAKDKKWVTGDLYPVVYDMTGKCLAHGHNERQVGKLLIDIGDADGKPFIRQRIALAKSEGRFWQEYKFTDPITKKVLPKAAYCETTGELIVCAGVYQR